MEGRERLVIADMDVAANEIDYPGVSLLLPSFFSGGKSCRQIKGEAVCRSGLVFAGVVALGERHLLVFSAKQVPLFWRHAFSRASWD